GLYAMASICPAIRRRTKRKDTVSRGKSHSWDQRLQSPALVDRKAVLHFSHCIDRDTVLDHGFELYLLRGFDRLFGQAVPKPAKDENRPNCSVRPEGDQQDHYA